MSVFAVILVRIFPHSDWMGRDTEYTHQNNSEYGYFSRSVSIATWVAISLTSVFNFSIFDKILISWEKSGNRLTSFELKIKKLMKRSRVTLKLLVAPKIWHCGGFITAKLKWWNHYSTYRYMNGKLIKNKY